jgi:MFS family permease
MRRDRLLLYTAALARSTAVGMSGVLIALYVAGQGLGAGTLGIIVSAGLLGAAAGTALSSAVADRLGRRATLLAVTGLSVAGTALFALASAPWALALTAFLGMVNGMGRDRGAAYALEQALLPDTTTDRDRTRTFAWYTLTLDGGHALGAAAAASPALLRATLGLDPLASYRASLLIVAALTLIGAAAYAGLSPRVLGETRPSGAPAPLRPPLTPESRRRIARLSGLFAIDSVGGGFLTGALLSYWFFRRFGVGEEALAPLFLAARVANGLSHLGAAWLARRIGLLNTMVFTHLPSSLLLLTVPIAPSFGVAAALFVLRECLVEMDVPTRQSYVVAVVRPEERVAASGATNLVRTLGWAVAPVFAGASMQAFALGMPLVLGASLKMAYDVLLYRAFRNVRPPEEADSAPAIPSGGSCTGPGPSDTGPDSPRTRSSTCAPR